MMVVKHSLAMLIVAAAVTTPGVGNDAPPDVAAELESTLQADGIEAAVAYYRRVAGDPAASRRLDEASLVELSRRLAGSARYRDAAEIGQVTVEAFPDSWRAWEALGEAHSYVGNRFFQAVECFGKAVELSAGAHEAKTARARLAGLEASGVNETKTAPLGEPGEPLGVTGPYLGQQPPGREPQVFAPGIVSLPGSFEYGITFSPDGRECFFTRSQHGTMTSRLTDRGWAMPSVAQGVGGEPHITPDGRLLLFNRVIDRSTTPPKVGIAAMERTASGWSEAKHLLEGYCATATRDGTIYVTRRAGRGHLRDLVRYRPAGGGYSGPEELEGGVSTPWREAHPGVAPAESYLLFDSIRPDGLGWADVFVAFRRSDGRWSQGISLGDRINTAGNNICASVSPDGEYVFYCANNDIYWVSSRVIQELRSDAR